MLHCNGVTALKQVENKVSKRELWIRISIDVMSRAREQKFVCSSIETFLAQRFDANEIPLFHTRVWFNQFWWTQLNHRKRSCITALKYFFKSLKQSWDTDVRWFPIKPWPFVTVPRLQMKFEGTCLSKDGRRNLEIERHFPSPERCSRHNLKMWRDCEITSWHVIWPELKTT